MITEAKDRPRAIAWCSWHNGLSDTTRLIHPGPDGHLFACNRCRQAYELTPIGQP